MTSEPITRQEFEDGMNVLRFEFKADIARVDTNIAQLETRLVRWMVTLMVGAVVISSTIASTIVVVAQGIID